MMTKLYKKDGKNYSYWELWDNNKVITIHWDTLGELGSTKNIKVNFWQKLEEIFKKEVENAKKEGYEEIPLENHYQLIVQLKTKSKHPTTQDLDKRINIESVINHSLGWIGVGHTDGGDIGNGTMNIFSYVVDPNIATKNILEVFKDKGIDEKVTIASRRGENIEVLYPKNYKGKFNY